MKEINVQTMRDECKKLPIETQSALFRQLMCAVLNEAVEDYVGNTPLLIKNSMPKYFFNPATIMKDLHSPRMITLSDGMSQTVAMQLKNNPEQIKENLAKLAKEYNIIKVDTYDTPRYR